jgi:DNA-binding MurR/RpiR family transcriptional regulator
VSSPPFAGSKTSVLVRLSAIEADLRESERKIGDYLLHHAPELVHLSITELADATNTSEATVIRFAQRLGYPGFSALKIALALELRDSASPLPGDVTPDDDIGTIKRKVLDTSLGGLRDTADLLGEAALLRAVEALDSAHRVEAYGVGSSAAVAHDAYAQLVQIGIPIVAVTDPHLQVLSAVQLEPGDVVLAISESGSTRDTLEAVEAAREAGATCICLTRHARSPITRVADIVLLAAARPMMLEGFQLVDRLAQLLVIDILWVALALRRKEHSRAALARGRQALSARKRL